MSFCLYLQKWCSSPEGFRGDASRPPDHIQPAPCTTLPRNGHTDLKGQKILVYSGHCFRGYCCGNYLDPVVQWTKLGLPRTLSQTRLGQVSTWMGDHTYWSVHFNSRFSSTSSIELFEISLRVTYCVYRSATTNASCQSIACFSSQTNFSVEFYPRLVQGFFGKASHMGRIDTVNKALTNSCGILC